MANPDDESGRDSDCGEDLDGGVSLVGHEDMMDLGEGLDTSSDVEGIVLHGRSITDPQSTESKSLSKLIDGFLEGGLESGTATAAIEHTMADTTAITDQEPDQDTPVPDGSTPTPGLGDAFAGGDLPEVPTQSSTDGPPGLNEYLEPPLFSQDNDSNNPFDQDHGNPSFEHEASIYDFDHFLETDMIESSLLQPSFEADFPPYALGGFGPHEERKNMSFVECLSFCHTGNMSWQPKPPSSDEDALPRLTSLDIVEGMQSIRKDTVTASDVEQEQCDIQGIDWGSFKVSRNEIRKLRRKTYFNHVNVLRPNWSPQGYNHWPTHTSAPYVNLAGRVKAAAIPHSRKYFRFTRMNRQHRISIPHFQLRHIVSASSKNAIFFPTVSHNESSDYPDDTGSQITCLNPSIVSKEDSHTIIDAAHTTASPDIPKMAKIYTLSATNSILVAGGFGGEYAYKPLSSLPQDPFTAGIITISPNSSTNHVHTYLDRRSGLPRAVFASNDNNVHTLDAATNTFLSRHDHSAAVNCAATSPDTRLRVLVRDATHPLLVEADTGRRIGKLHGHADFGFSCDWSPEGIYFATGAQDGVVQIFDARSWRKPVQTFATELGGVRALRFSPQGSEGEQVLVMAESADFVHVLRGPGRRGEGGMTMRGGTGEGKQKELVFGDMQTFDFFGEIAGISFDGEEGGRLFVGVGDKDVGGIMELERCRGGRGGQWGRGGSGIGWGFERSGIKRKGKGERDLRWRMEEEVERDEGGWWR
ncbi:MAG: hypothetical protein Q9220_006410 [cf. Caloplaca sp. 1 TL-2023]